MVTPTALSSQKAKSADSFIDTVGVNTHLHYTDKVYGKRFDDIIQPRLNELGIRHVRDTAKTYVGINQNSFFYQRVRDLANQGIKFTFITPALSKDNVERTNYNLLDEVYQWSNGAVEAFEGTNEPNLRGVSTWIAETRKGQQQLYEKVNSDPRLKRVSVAGPSVTTANGAHKKIGDLSKWLDYGNIHSYFSNRNPDTKGWDLSGYGSATWRLASAKPISGSKAVITTETGWDNTIPKTGGGHDGQGIPKDVAAKYVPRLFLNQFNEGIARTFIYELIDVGTNPKARDENLGLLRNNGSRKPSFTALKNLIHLLEDPNPTSSFVPRNLAFSLAGETDGVRHTLLQKSDGDFYLALWQTDIGWDPKALKRLPVADQAVTLSLKDIKQATLYQLDSQGDMKTSKGALTNNQLKLNVKDTVMVVKLSPKTAKTNSASSTSALSPISYEAESLKLSGGYMVESQSSSKASKGKFIALRKSRSGSAAGVFQGKAGTYDVKAHYFDENDGASSASITVDGNKKSFKLDKNLPANYASSKTLTNRITHQDLVLNPGDRFEIKGSMKGDEFVRFDRIDFIPVDSAVAGRSSLGSTSSQAQFSGLDQTAHSGLLDYKGAEAGIGSVSTDAVSQL